MSTNNSSGEYSRSRDIGISRPLGKGAYEIAVSGDFGHGIESTVMNAILDCNGKLIRQISEGEVFDNFFVAEYFVDASNLSCSITDLVKRIESMPHVKQVHYQNREGYLYSHFIFPLTAFRRGRVIAFRADTLLRMQERLAQILGSAASTVFYEEGRSYGEAIVRNHRFLLRDTNQQLLLENLKEGARATGWGLVDFEQVEENLFRLVLKHPPLGADGQWKDTWLLYGAFAGILESVYNCKLSVDGSDYNKETDVLTVTYKPPERS